MTPWRPSWRQPGRPGSGTAGAWRARGGPPLQGAENIALVLVLVLRDCGLRRSEAAALVCSGIERWDDGSGRLLIERSKTDMTGEGEVVFITRRTMTALDELQHLRGDESPSVFGMTANTINCRVKAAGLDEDFSGHRGRVGLARRTAARAGAPDSAVMQQVRLYGSNIVANTSVVRPRESPPGTWNERYEPAIFRGGGSADCPGRPPPLME